MQFQYKVIVQSDPEILEEELNAAGEEGYELVSATPNPDGGLTVIVENAIDDEEDDEELDEEEEE
jgi:hypothetical protein